MNNYVKYIKGGIVLICAFLLYFIAYREHFVNHVNADETTSGKVELQVFVQNGCIHCENAEKWLNTNPFNDKINVVYYNLKEQKSADLLLEHAKKFNIPRKSIGTPVFVIQNDYIMGFSEMEKSKLIDLVKNIN